MKVVLKIAFAFIAFFVFLGFLSGLTGLAPKSGTVVPLTTAASEATGIETSPVTMANFERLHTGMTYRQAASILGEGTQMSRVDLYGTSTVMYSWRSSGIGNMSATFQNGRMISKAQFGLR
jgi:hypothetical protein